MHITDEMKQKLEADQAVEVNEDGKVYFLISKDKYEMYESLMTDVEQAIAIGGIGEFCG